MKKMGNMPMGMGKKSKKKAPKDKMDLSMLFGGGKGAGKMPMMGKKKSKKKSKK